MLILFISYTDFRLLDSGAWIRPQNMLRGFQEAGHEVRLLTGDQGKRNRKNRREAVGEISRWLDTNRPDLCYVESPVYPILWKYDRDLLRKIHAMGIPIGYFYRDYYRRFPDLFPRRTSLLGRAREFWLDHLQRVTDRLLKLCDIVYFPSALAAALFPYEDRRLLPPAGVEERDPAEPEGKTCIYVGGLTEHYDGELLLKTFSLLNREKTEYPLILVCRKEEWERMPPEYRSAPWLELHHASGRDLDALYRRAGAGLLIPAMPNAYNDLAISVKLFEYMSYGLPVVYIRSAASHEFISRYGFGIDTDPGPENLAAGVREMFSDGAAYAARREASRAALRLGNRWVDRAQQVVQDLTGKQYTEQRGTECR